MIKSKQLETSLVIVLGLIAGYFFRHSDRWLAAALLIGGFSLLVPAFAGVVHWGWMKLSSLMGAISGKVLLTLVYILLLVPLAWLARLLGHSSLRRKATGSSYFTERDHRYGKEDLRHPW
jgi:uncharacterized membrane protein (Fun14 family)